MRYTWLDEYLMKKPSVTKNTENWNWVRYMIGGKMFVAICLDDHDAPYYITLKLDPIEGEFFRKQYEDIVPGFYMNKIHWNSIKPDGNVPDDLLKTFVDKSYQLILKGFSKKMQQEILSGAQQ
ncbi:MAG: MmcQ/YjbR family DNA-binding protein [Clostridia bacterium]|nr:MmcQ/YjbR family DNA-binding protein [Clostridia bacterium]MBQ6804106.1 MmcQ/YjbR family DNA-binding protein [Clostridia bacterium]